MASVLAFLTAIISLLFATTVLWQFARRRRPYQFVWAVGLLSYGVASLALGLAAAGGWSDLTYRLYYLFGAVYAAAFMGMGTCYLLLPRWVADTIMVGLGIVAVAALAVVAVAPVDLAGLPHPTEVSGAAMPAYVRMMTPPLNIFGTLALVGGALASAWGYWRRRSMPQRVVSNVLIAAGSLITASGGTLVRLGVPTPWPLALFAGILIIYVGFLVNQEILSLRPRWDHPAPAPPAGSLGAGEPGQGGQI